MRWLKLEVATLHGRTVHVISFELVDTKDGCELHFRHDDAPAEMVAPGWERFLGSLVELVETGTGRPFRP